eukprot:Skav205668  [mRNA]  locus=scaffold458:444370:445216:+ [translate_table: standard]
MFFISPGKPKTAPAPAPNVDGWRPKSIQLLGKQKVQGLGRFPSDHWGLLTVWTGGSELPAPAATSSFRRALATKGSAEGLVIDLDGD